jgi:hypothetical protein
MEEGQLNVTVWKLLFGEDFPDIPDPNLPENVPHYKAKLKQKREQFKTFAEGVGKPLFEQWQGEMRAGLFTLITKEDMLDNEVIRLLDKIRDRAKMMAKAQSLINEDD